jgi:hypothetical protein
LRKILMLKKRPFNEDPKMEPNKIEDFSNERFSF